MHILKIGGNEIDSPAFLAGLAGAVAGLEGPRVLVHGGGKEISAALERYGHASEFIGGLRATSPESMPIVEMVLSGAVNKRVVRALLQAGVRALGLSGVDLGVLQAVPYRPGGVDYGQVGEVVAVDQAVLRAMLAQGWLPVISPVALGRDDGQAYNVNADQAAAALARGLQASELIFISNVPGVLVDGQVQPALTSAQVGALITTGIISGGMVPKVRAALDALDDGVGAVRITDLAGLVTGGTRLTA